jgi:asparagine synthase (glutamine-hydrolysing)
MLEVLRHRGPDDEGLHAAPPVALGARRLSIIDLQTGRQPVRNEDESIWAVQNGEIYNYLELREELEAAGHAFRSKGDTEVLVHLYEEHGEDFVHRLVGMFAIAVWDARAGRLLLVRDRLGQKPLYYARREDGLVFASEIKALLAGCPDLSRDLDYAALGEYLTKLYIGGERSIYAAVRKLPPAHLLIADRDGLATHRYWSPWDVPPRSGMLVEDDLVEELGEKLRESVRLRLRSDVPLGCFLSGGVDSSLIAALACELSAKVKTFTVGFGRGDYDESPHARTVAEHLGTEHHEYRVEDDIGELARRIPGMFDEPFADSSAVPTWHVAKTTRSEVTVALSGDGGDEVFGGYRRYRARRMAARYGRLPRAALGAVSGLARLLGGGRSRYGGSFRENLRRFASYATQVRERPWLTRPEYFDAAMQEKLLRPEAREQLRAAVAAERGPAELAAGLDPAELAMRLDLVDYLPDDILVKVDRTSMDVSLEARAPLLDHRVVEFMLSLRPEWKLRGRTGKYLLKRLAERVLPKEIVRRPKHGFALPLADWFAPEGVGRKALADLFPDGASDGPIRPEAVRALLETQDAGRADLGEHLWAVMVLGMTAI